MNDKETFLRAVENFLLACPTNFDFPVGGIVKIPLEPELALAVAIEVAPPSNEQLTEFRKKLSMRQAYQLVIFAIRMAILAVRTNSVRLFRSAIFGFAIDNGVVDWRDNLRALSIIENCALRLGIDLKSEFEELNSLMGDKLKETLFEGYFRRSPEMRTIAIMGFVVKDTEDGVSYA